MFIQAILTELAPVYRGSKDNINEASESDTVTRSMISEIVASDSLQYFSD